MTIAFPEIKTFLGLYLQRNSFNLPDGCMEVAENVVISYDNVCAKVRGNYVYFDPLTGTLNKNFTYQDKLLSVYNNKVAYYADTGSSPNETGTESVLSGETVAVTGSRVSRKLEASQNLYFTTDNGVLKLTSHNSTVEKSGAPQGLDLVARFSNTQTSSTWFTSSASVTNQVGYRVLFGYQDSNGNLILGAPSQVSTISNPFIDNAVASAVGAVVTVTSTGHGLVTGQYVTVVGAAGFGTSSNANGLYQVTVTGANTFTYTAGGAPGGGPGTVDYYNSSPVRLEGSVPSEISTSQQWFVQVYRSSQQDENVGVISDYKLAVQRTLTSSEITARVFFYDDDTPDLLLGAELYTNENSREGELQANYRPPLCKDMALFNDSSFYANCITRHLLQLSVVNAGALGSGDYIEVKIEPATPNASTVTNAAGDLQVNYVAHGLSAGDTVYVSSVTGGILAVGTYFVVSPAANSFEISATAGGASVAFNSETALVWTEVRRYVARTGVGNETVVGTVSNAGGDLQIDYVAHGLSNGDTVYISNVVGGTLATGTYYVVSAGANAFEVSLTSGGASVAFSSESSLEFQGITNGTLYIFTLSTDPLPSVSLRDTAEGIVKAMNRDTGSLIYSQYSSLPDEVPGRMTWQAKGFGNPVYVRANGISEGTAFFPVLPAAFSAGNQVFSTNETLQNVLYISKKSEPEAVPLINFIPVGAKNKPIRRIHALRDNLIILKDDGAFKLNGDNINNYSVTILDSTVKIVAEDSSDVINNQVIFLSNQGVCLVTESSVEIISRAIEDVIQPILGQAGLETVTTGVAYESERSYYLTTSAPNDTSASVTYVYNILTSAWTTVTSLLRRGVIGPFDVLYYIGLDNNIYKERKKQTRLDFTGQNYAVTISNVSGDQTSCDITLVTSAIPEIGDIVVKADVINTIATAPVFVSGTTYTVTFLQTSNLANADSVILYSNITSTVKFAPFHAGLVGRTKQFSQFIIQFRDNSCSKLYLTFFGQTYGGSEETIWENPLVYLGWGLFPWGFAPWGQEQGIDLFRSTEPAAPARIYIPRFQSRSSFIQPMIIHKEAGEPFRIQGLSYAVRPYAERITR